MRHPLKSWKPRAEAHRRITQRAAGLRQAAAQERERATAATDSSGRGYQSTPELPQEVKDWLARLFLLYGVPFEYLVPDYRMLPSESIRWAFLDINWLQRAMDGALSIGRTGSWDLLTDAAIQPELVDATLKQSQLVRAQLRGDTIPTEVSENGQATIMLVRSAVVGGYPGLEVRGLDAQQNDVKLLRMDQLAPDVLLVMFEDLPDEVQMIEPPEGLHFGVRIGSVSPCSGGNQVDNQPYTFLRSLQSGQIGQQIDSVQSRVFYRNDDASLRVLDLDRTLDELQCWLEKKDAWPNNQALSAADFAVEMVRAAGLQRFDPGEEDSSE